MSERECRRVTKERCEGFCERCCYGGTLTLHHRKKRSQGGLWTAENCVQLCGHGTAGCHGWVEHNPNAAAAEGWHVRPWEDPAAIPLLWRGSTWVLLTPEGTFTDDADVGRGP
ncbi:HNH endonuclease [Mycolicibacterium sphagni]|uniref:HNH endonuclease n=1 Tax=Mycolicibacterium sphagni TaxID=1786 RepID=A0A255DQK2_9MYCO|nr:HNH endonuclease [Mycolicibacterium sphagni]